jgi:hypothetical protein
MMWVLILFAHAGPMSDKDSMALTNVTGFVSESQCRAAGEEAKHMTDYTTKIMKYRCVGVGK